MIPKIIQIHQFFGTGQFNIIETVDAYTAIMPDYEIMPIAEVPQEFIDEWDDVFLETELSDAFKADVIRYWLMWKYGGFYVDCDSRPLRRFDPLCEHEIFIAGCPLKDRVAPYFCICGSEPGNKFWLDCLKHCRKRKKKQPKAHFQIGTMGQLIEKSRVVLIPNIVFDILPFNHVPSSTHYIRHYGQQHQEVSQPEEQEMQGIINRAGLLMMPARGKPPAAPEGYEVTDNPFVFAPILDPCPARTKEEVTSSCCGTRQITVCTHFGKNVTYKDCMECTVDLGEES